MVDNDPDLEFGPEKFKVRIPAQFGFFIIILCTIVFFAAGQNIYGFVSLGVILLFVLGDNFKKTDDDAPDTF